MNLANILAAPITALLFKWTILLLLAWGAQLALIRRHARWRIILWRCVLCFGLVLPLSSFVELPGIKIPMPASSAAPLDIIPITAPVVAHPSASITAPPPAPAAGSAVNAPTTPQNAPTPLRQAFPWMMALAAIWIIGCAVGVLRLIHLQWSLVQLRRRTSPPTPEIDRLAQQVRTTLKVQAPVAVRLSNAITSPFVFGIFRPTIMLPQSLAQQLTPGELASLLNHEFAHVRQHDLPWSVAWQWMRIICWFHPLVWQVPSAHGLACEQEADRIASGQMPDQSSYAQLLARLALRVLALPMVETRLTMNGNSQITRRLKLLGQDGISAWKWRHSVVAFCLTTLLFFLVAGCKMKTGESAVPDSPATMVFKKVLVTVQDDDGKPLQGAVINPEGFRVKGIHGADAYGWNNKLFGPPETVVTDADGKAYIKYPVEGIPAEKEYTGQLFFSVSHSDYCTARPQEYSVDGTEPPIRLTPGITLKVSGYFGSNHEPVPELAPMLNQEEIRTNDWQKDGQNAYSFNTMSPGGHLLQLMGRLPSGEIVYSEVVEFTAEKGKKYNFDLEMKPGVRVEGRVDDQVPRPITNGRVLICVRPKEFPAWTNWDMVDGLFQKYPNVEFWRSYRTIAADGTFVFESVPPGGLDVIVCGDGFVSKDGGVFKHGFAVPQAFELTAPTTKVEVITEPTATLELTAKTKHGKPIAGATIWLNPNVIRIGGIFGDMGSSSEEPFQKLAPLPDIHYTATTDKDGLAVISNVPASSDDMEIDHPQYQVPLQEHMRDRFVRLSFVAGATNKLAITLEPKGADYIGTGK